MFHPREHSLGHLLRAFWKKSPEWWQDLTVSVIGKNNKKLTWGTQLRRMMKMKYRLANRWNCSNKFLGKNDKMVYFVVLILLMKKPWFGCSLGGVFSSIKWFGTTKRVFCFCFFRPMRRQLSMLPIATDDVHGKASGLGVAAPQSITMVTAWK